MSIEIITAILGGGGAATLVTAIWKMVQSFRAGSDKRNLSALEIAERQRDDARTQETAALAAKKAAEQRAAIVLLTLNRTRSYCASQHGTPWDELPKLPEEN